MTPPRLWRWLLLAATPAADRRFVDADMTDGFDERVAQDGVAAARAWYGRQVRRSIVPLVRARVHLAVAAFANLSGAFSMRDLRSDLLFLWRRTRRRPLVPLVVVLTMALGIGAATAVFSVADAVLFKPLPLPDSGRVMRFYGVLTNGTFPSINYFDLRDIQTSSQTLAGSAAYLDGQTTLRLPGGPEPLPLVQTGPGYMGVLGMSLAIGRDFDASEYRTGAEPVAILTDRFWRRAFGANPAVLDQTLDLDGVRTRIVGVLRPAEFHFPAAADIWTPLVIGNTSYLNNRMSVGLSAIARVRADRSVDDAQRELSLIDARLKQTYPFASGRRSILLRPLADTLAAPVRPTLMLLSGIVLAVLLIAATNIADLLLGDAASRGREFAIRAAIGGAASRLARQVVVESIALAIAGGLAGALLAPLLVRALIELYPTPLPRLAEIGLHARAYGVALLATLLAGLLVSLPLVHAASRQRLTSALRDGDRGTGRRGLRLASALVVIEVALSVALLAAGLVLARTFLASASTDLGFSTDNTLTFFIAPSQNQYPDATAVTRFYDTLLPSLERIPGVTHVGMTQFLPFTPGNWGDNLIRVGTSDRPPDLPEISAQPISPGLPAALGLRVIAGRGFEKTDTAAAPLVAAVNETVARRYFDGAPLGREVIFQKQTWRIVGVLADKRHAGVVEPPRPELFVPWEQFGRVSGWVVMRTSAPPLSVLPAAKEALRGIDPTIPATRALTMDQRVASAIAPERFRATLTGALACAAVILAALGLYGVMAHAVTRRTHEIGLRLALGESPGRVRRSIVRSAVLLAMSGIGAGLALAFWTAPWLQAFLNGAQTPRDVTTLLIVSVVLLAVAVLAAWIPARRAATLDPAQVLRAN